MERDQGRWTADGGDDGRNDEGGWDADRPFADHDDRPLSNADFVDPPRYEQPPRDPARPLYDGRPVRDPYARGGGYRRASDDVWARARVDYLAGDTAETVCARHDLRVSTLRARAAAEGWRRQDAPDPEPVDLDAEIEAGLPAYADMARHALVRLNRAVLSGRAAEAARWMRLHARLQALAEAEAAPPPPAAPPTVKAAAKPARTPDRSDRISARIKTLAEATRTLKALSEQPHPRAMDQFEKMLALLSATPISDDSDDSDGVFPPLGSDTGPP